MLKPHGTCKLCKSSAFLNFAGLCKRCNKKEESVEIKGKVAETQKKALEARKEMEEQQKVELEETPALEETSDEADDKKKEDEKGSK
ncbi:hypothetical protein KKA03_04770 [archaeon]|nr:hypothetical protein [archaeon]